MHHLDVSKAGLVFCTVVDDPLTTVDQPILPQLIEGTINRFHHLRVKRKDHIFPVGPNAKGAQLELHIAPLLIDKVPHLCIQLITRVIEARLALLL